MAGKSLYKFSSQHNGSSLHVQIMGRISQAFRNCRFNSDCAVSSPTKTKLILHILLTILCNRAEMPKVLKEICEENCSQGCLMSVLYWHTHTNATYIGFQQTKVCLEFAGYSRAFSSPRYLHLAGRSFPHMKMQFSHAGP